MFSEGCHEVAGYVLSTPDSPHSALLILHVSHVSLVLEYVKIREIRGNNRKAGVCPLNSQFSIFNFQFSIKEVLNSPHSALLILHVSHVSFVLEYVIIREIRGNNRRPGYVSLIFNFQFSILNSPPLQAVAWRCLSVS